LQHVAKSHAHQVCCDTPREDGIYITCYQKITNMMSVSYVEACDKVSVTEKQKNGGDWNKMQEFAFSVSIGEFQLLL
jgi:hypothetical protein